MKTPRLNISIMTAIAVGTIIFICSADARPSKIFARYGRHAEDSSAVGERSVRVAGKFKQLPNQNRLANSEQVQGAANYPRYRLIDLGTLGGPNAGVWGGSVQLNNRGEVIAQLGTPVPDPDCLNFDCFVWHGVVREINGVVTDLGALPGENNSAPVWITNNGLIAGLSENGSIDPLTGFPQLRAALWNRDRSIVDLGTLGGNASLGLAANSGGRVVGWH